MSFFSQENQMEKGFVQNMAGSLTAVNLKTFHIQYLRTFTPNRYGACCLK